MPIKDESPQLTDIREDDLLALSAEVTEQREQSQTSLDSAESRRNSSKAQVLDTLLRDHTTGRNIFWATHDYEALGSEYDYHSEILPHLITGEHGMVIRPRVLKSKEEQTDRAKDMAEVFTPSWVVKMMVDYVNIDINTRCLELTCGEAPFLVSRYDATTGEPMAINERIGVLDRKLRLINDQQLNDEEWLGQVRQAFQSTYGYEWQGDSLLLARENLLYTFWDHYKARFSAAPDISLMQDFAEIISWNLWQMDGLSYCIPQEKAETPPHAQLSLFDEAPARAIAPLCKIMDWQKGNAIKVNDIKKRLTKNQNIMKFDVIIGNPPYQEELEGTSNPPIYNYFMDESYKNAQIVELITPARWLFNAGKTPKEWNKKMLRDKHLKVLYYQADSSKFFSNTDIKGGIVVTYHDNKIEYGAIDFFSQYDELNTIIKKVINSSNFICLNTIMYTAESYKLTQKFHDDNPKAESRLSVGHKYDLTSNIFTKLKDYFFDEKPNDGNDYIQILGRINGKRDTKWIRKEYICEHDNLQKYKVFFPEANGNGQFGEIMTPGEQIGPGIGTMQTFISIGAFDTEFEAVSTMKYLKTKFLRTMLGSLKVTQHNHMVTWKHVPLQDFTSNSDIDWSKSIAEIDEQLFDKYGLDEQERNFIRTKVKEMV